MLAALTAIFNAAAAYLRLKLVSAAYDLSRRIENDIARDEDQIRILRSEPNSDNQLLADRLRNRLARAQGILADLPTPRAGP